MRRWAPLISPSKLSAGTFEKRPEISARSISNLNRSSNVCRLRLPLPKALSKR